MNFSVDTSQHDFTSDDLYLLSNDIPQSHTPECEEDSDSEELDVGRLNHCNYQLQCDNKFRTVCIFGYDSGKATID